MSGQDQKVLSFQGLRAVAFLAIFLVHCNYLELTQAACWSVSFYFMISGYLSGYSVHRGQFPACDVRNSVSYTLRRTKKLYGLHILTLIVSIPVSGAIESIQAEGLGKLPYWVIIFLMNVTLTKSLYPKYYFGFNGVNWFLSSYVVLCLLTPFLLSLANRVFGRGNRKKNHLENPVKYLLAIVILSVLNFLYCHGIQVSQAGVEYWIYICPFARLAEYLAGILAGMCHDRIPKKWLPVMQWVSIAMILFLTLGIDLPEWLFRTAIWIIPNVLLLWGFHSENGILARIAGSKAMVFLGDQSANMFLIHQVLIRYMDRYLGMSDFGKLIPAYLITLGVALAYRAGDKKLKMILEKRQKEKLLCDI